MTCSIDSKRSSWEQVLRKVRSEPLDFCPEFPAVAEQWLRWWRFDSDRPLFAASVREPADIRWDKAFDLLDQPEEWLRVRKQQVEKVRCVGDAIPYVRVDLGPVTTAVFVGTPLHFAPEEQTSWQEPIIESWDDVDLALDSSNQWYTRALELIERTAEDARGRYLVCLPDLTGAVDALANLRGSERLCFDLLEHRAAIRAAADQMVDVWETAFSAMYDGILRAGAGTTQWLGCWADEPFTVPTCDFNALIGPDDFQELCLPSLSEQGRRAGTCVFHLDGPDAARHAEALACDPNITAIQYTPGAGSPSALAKLPVLKMIQSHRVPLYIITPVDEVKPLADALDPTGLAIVPEGVESLRQAEELYEWIQRRFA